LANVKQQLLNAAASRKSRVRRSGAEIRRRLLESARDVFSSKGFSAASTREIAERAEVAEGLLFRHFRTKVLLFEKAIVEPITRFINDYADRAVERARLSPVENVDEDLTQEYVSGLYGLLRKNRHAIMAMLSANAHSEGVGARFNQKDSAISEALDRLLDHADQEMINAAGYRDVDASVNPRAVFGMILSLAVLDDFLFPHGERYPSEKRVIKEIVSLVLHGVRHRPEH
jgi:AcrR family transcriptional regulator